MTKTNYISTIAFIIILLLCLTNIPVSATEAHTMVPSATAETETEIASSTETTATDEHPDTGSDMSYTETATVNEEEHSVLISEEETDTDRKTSINTIPITRINFAASQLLRLMKINEHVSSVLPKNDFTIHSAIVFHDSGRDYFPIEYNVDEFDSSHTGLVLLHGTIIPSEGYSIDEELAQVTIPIFLYDPDHPTALPLTGRINFPSLESTYIAAVGSSKSEAAAYLAEQTRTQAMFRVGEYQLSLAVTWDVSGLDTDTPGTYRIPGKVFPHGLLVPDEYAHLSCYGDIQDINKLTLSPPILHSGSSLEFHWMKQFPEDSSIEAYYSINDGAWTSTDEDPWFIDLRPSYSCMNVYLSDLQKDTKYRFCVKTDSEVSNTIDITLNDSSLLDVVIGGDRDGGDRDEQTPPDVNQPADKPPLNSSNTPVDQNVQQNPENPPSIEPDSDRWISGLPFGSALHVPSPNTREDAAFSPDTPNETAADINDTSAIDSAYEADTADYTIWSGKRIIKYLEVNQGLPLSFEKHGIRLTFPVDNRLAGMLTEKCSLTVTIVSPDAHTVQMNLSLNDSPLPEIPPLTITMPWEPAPNDEILEIVNQRNQVLAETIAEAGSSTITFTIKETGTFKIRKSHKTTPPVKADTATQSSFDMHITPVNDTVPSPQGGIMSRKTASVLLICICLLTAFSVGMLFLHRHIKQSRKKRKKRE